MAEILAGGVRLVRFGGAADPPNSSQLSVLRNTLDLLSPEHLAALSSIEARRPGQVPLTGGGNDGASGIVRLSSASFSEHDAVNLTFLHEMGHIVDYRFRCTEQIQAMARQPGHPFRQDAAALLATPHIGGTHGLGERIADCYMVLFRSIRISRSYSSRSCRTQWIGAEGQRRIRVLLATTAFRHLTVEQLEREANGAGFDRLIRTLV